MSYIWLDISVLAYASDGFLLLTLLGSCQFLNGKMNFITSGAH